MGALTEQRRRLGLDVGADRSLDEAGYAVLPGLLSTGVVGDVCRWLDATKGRGC